MGKGKLAKFAEMARMECVYEFPYTHGEAMSCPLRGRWHDDVFHNANPIVLELGCGRGEYTVGLARLNPDVNYIGVDIKGARMWTGARQAEAECLRNVAFLRTNIEIIDHFFAPGEVSEIWLTFSDPQMKKVTKRLTGTAFIQRYRHFLADGGLVHLKTDSNFLFTYTEEMLRANHITPLISTRHLYKDSINSIDSIDSINSIDSIDSKNPIAPPTPTSPTSLLQKARSIQTYYEGMWRSRGIDIKYLVFALHPTPTPLIEPEVEIPLDEYRSYNRDKRSENETHL